MGVPQEIAKEDACRVEHDISPETFDKIKDLLERFVGYD
ncbi:MAG: iron dependent repressor, metal binding and dimerization domain protein [Oscillospiraceae bacterium]